MKAHMAVMGLSLLAAWISAPASVHAQQADSQQHEQHHPAGAPSSPAPPQAAPMPAQPQADTSGMMARMKASGARLDVLVRKMNAASGAAKIDAIAELLTAMVEDRREHEAMMGGMHGMMPMMPGRAREGLEAPPAGK